MIKMYSCYSIYACAHGHPDHEMKADTQLDFKSVNSNVCFLSFMYMILLFVIGRQN